MKVSEAPGYGMTILDYDPGSRGAMSYLDASREIAERGERRSEDCDEEGHDGCPMTLHRGDEPMTKQAGRRSGLGRGLASLIPTGPADGESGDDGAADG